MAHYAINAHMQESALLVLTCLYCTHAVQKCPFTTHVTLCLQCTHMHESALLVHVATYLKSTQNMRLTMSVPV